MFRKNVASQFIHFQGVDSATGGIKSGVTWTVRRCIDGTFAAGGGTVTEDGSTGWYKYAMSQADTNGNNIAFNFTGTGAIPQTVNIVTTAADPTDAVRFGLTALPNANAEAAGGLYTRGTGAGQINQPGNGQIDANAVKLGGTTQTGRDIGASVLLSPGTGTGQVDLSSGKVLLQATQTGVTIPTVTAVTNDVGITQAGADKVWSSASRTLTAFSTALAVSVWDVLTANISTASSIGLKLKNWVLGSDSKVLLSSDAQTGVTIPTTTSVTNGVTVTTNNDKTGYGLSSAAVQAIWDALSSALTTAGSIGKRIVDFLTGDAFARLGAPAGASVSADVASVKTDTAAIKLKTDNLPTSPAATGDIPTTTQITNAVLDESLDSHNTSGTVGGTLSRNSVVTGFRQESGSMVRFYGGEIDPIYLGESVVVVSSLTINYDNQFQGMLFVIDDTNFPASIKFVATILFSDQGDNSFTLSKPLPSVTATDPIPFLILPAGMGDATRALILYEGN